MFDFVRHVSTQLKMQATGEPAQVKPLGDGRVRLIFGAADCTYAVCGTPAELAAVIESLKTPLSPTELVERLRAAGLPCAKVHPGYGLDLLPAHPCALVYE